MIKFKLGMYQLEGEVFIGDLDRGYRVMYLSHTIFSKEDIEYIEEDNIEKTFRDSMMVNTEMRERVKNTLAYIVKQVDLDKEFS